MSKRCFRAKQLSREEGSIIVQVTLTIFPVFMLLMGLIYFIYLCFMMLAMQYVTNQTARWATMGNTIDELSRVESIDKTFHDIGSSMGIGFIDTNLRICPAETPDCTVPSAAASEEFIILTASKQFEFPMGLGNYTIDTQALAKNEPF